MKIDEVTSYRRSCELAELVWRIVGRWNTFEKHTVGSQFVRSSDSIGANIAEGFGRHHKKDKVKFYYNARASVFEVQFWVKRAHDRGLISVSEYTHIMTLLRALPREINMLIKITMENLRM